MRSVAAIAPRFGLTACGSRVLSFSTPHGSYAAAPLAFYMFICRGGELDTCSGFCRNRSARSRVRRFGAGITRCSMDVALGGGGSEVYYFGNVPKFPRMNIWDPYERLGVTRDASEEEILEARNFLLKQYGGHESSYESVEAAFEKILMASFWKCKKSKINLKSRLKQQVEESPSWIKRLLEYVELPTTDVILRRLFLFGFMAVWSVTNSSETGPAFQVALSLLSCIYFLNDKMKNLWRASVTGLAAFVLGWFVGSIAVPVIPAVLPPTWTLELLTSLIAYIFLFLACTFLK